MPESVRSAFSRWAKRGMHWPFVHDPVDKIPSPTLMFFYLTFMLAFVVTAVASGAMIVKGDYLLSTMPSMGLVLMGFVFYRLRKLDRVKLDLNDQEIELSSNDDEESENTGEKDA